jgi:ectoine hydroxylase-related dioxygenase (phytanoyl-CoA dioxygenase family)
MNKLHADLKKNGFVLIKGFLSKDKNFLNFKRYLNNFLLSSLDVKKKSSKNLDQIITRYFNKRELISAYINDNINLSPSLQKVLTCDKILSLICKLQKVKKKNLIFNNQRFRIQIPNNDKVSNLPWHQDSHYNKVKNTKSIVVWVSIGRILKEMGPIIFKVSSHKLGQQKKKIIKKTNGGIAYTININNGELKKLKSVSFETNSGDVVLIDMNSVHTSGMNTTLNKIKYSAQARYHVVKKFRK